MRQSSVAHIRRFWLQSTKECALEGILGLVLSLGTTYITDTSALNMGSPSHQRNHRRATPCTRSLRSPSSRTTCCDLTEKSHERLTYDRPSSQTREASSHSTRRPRTLYKAMERPPTRTARSASSPEEARKTPGGKLKTGKKGERVHECDQCGKVGFYYELSLSHSRKA